MSKPHSQRHTYALEEALNRPSAVPPLLYTRTETCERLRMGRSKLDELIREGVIRSVKIGRSRRIPANALDDYIERLQREAA